MRSIFRDFWRDEAGAILSAELVTLGTVAVLGTTVGLSTVATAVNEEMTDIARAIRSLDQSYSFRGFSSCRAYSAGSCFTQQPVEQSIQALCAGGAPTPAQPTRVLIPTTAAVDLDSIPEDSISPPIQEAAPVAPPVEEEVTPAGEKLAK